MVEVPTDLSFELLPKPFAAEAEPDPLKVGIKFAPTKFALYNALFTAIALFAKFKLLAMASSTKLFNWLSL